jgi:magnesium-transporting ATPase (P-type)
MWNKIYSTALAIAVLVMASLDFYAYSWLQSTTRPTDVVQNYDYFAGWAWLFLWISSIVLLALANILYWRVQQAWGLWTTFLYFAFFVVVQTFLLESMYNTFRNQSFPGADKFSAIPFLGVILCVVAAVIVFFDQFLVSRLHKKMFGVAPEEINPPVDEAI